jgi:hypothetical protein
MTLLTRQEEKLYIPKFTMVAEPGLNGFYGFFRCQCSLSCVILLRVYF